MGARAKAIAEFRGKLDELERKSQESYDKAILTLAGGALGVTISFVKDVIGPDGIRDRELLLASWVCWGLALLSILFSFYSSQAALRRAIRQLDRGVLHKQTAGGWSDIATAALNAAGGLFFLAGTFVFVYFAHQNLG